MKKAKSSKVEDRALTAVGKFLRTQGWNCVVIGFKRIELVKRPYKFQIVLEFLGKKLKRKGNKK